jgi:hypothetical protein
LLHAFAEGRGNNRKIQSMGNRKVYLTGEGYDEFGGVLAFALSLLVI